MVTHSVVTGGAGFLGSHLCERLLADGHRVTCVDDFSSGALDNLSTFRDSTNFVLLLHDVADALPVQHRVDEIYNLACPASPTQYQSDPLRTMRTCVLGAFNVLELAHRTGARVVQASTSEVYGDPLVHPQVETYFGNVMTTSVRACYDEGKRSAETIFADHRRQFGTNVGIARIFNTYGPRMKPDDGRVITTFLHQGLLGDPLTVHGSGAQTRSFCYVSDTVEALVALMRCTAAPGGPINIGNPCEMTMLELAKAVVALSGPGATIEFLPARSDDPRRRCPDISLACATLGWQPTVSLSEGLLITRSHLIGALGKSTLASGDAGRSRPGDPCGS